MRGPEEWPSHRKVDRIRLTGPAATRKTVVGRPPYVVRHVPTYDRRPTTSIHEDVFVERIYSDHQGDSCQHLAAVLKFAVAAPAPRKSRNFANASQPPPVPTAPASKPSLSAFNAIRLDS